MALYASLGKNMSIREKLIVHDRSSYGEKYQDHCLEIYKICVEMADNISARRQSANIFFLIVNTSILGIAGYIERINSNWVLAVNLAAIFICYFWYRIIRSYKDLNSGKFKVIHEIEKELPLSPYDAEWEAIGRGENPKLYLPFTDIETRVPWAFMALHLIAFCLLFPWGDVISLCPD